MTGQRIGYIRVSSEGQNTQRQLEDKALNLDRIFTDHVSGKDKVRPALQEMLDFVREGDTIVLHSMDRLARNLDDLRQLVSAQTSRGVRVEFVKEGLIFSGDDTPMSQLMLSVMGAFAEFERALIKERQREGIEAAKKRGVYNGRKKALADAQITELKQRLSAGESKTSIAREFGISRETLYKYVRG